MSRMVMVFGGARGIGATVARAFARAGDQVAIAARSQAEVTTAAREIGATGHVCDILDAVAVEAMMAAAGTPDMVINAAAIQGGRGGIGPVWDTDPEAVAMTIGINLTGAFNVTRAALRAMRPAGKGTLVQFSGGGSTGARPGFAAYGASKTGVLRLVETAQAELDAEGSGIRVFALAPGAVATAMTREVLDNADRVPGEVADAGDIADGRAGVPPEMAAELCLFLATEAAAPLAGRLTHVREAYRDYVARDLGSDAGRLRRADYPRA